MADSALYLVELTAPGPGAVACLLVAGDAAATVCALLQRLTRRHNLDAVGVGCTTLAALRDASDAVIDDALLVRIARDRWEIHLHGGPAVVAAALDALQQLGARLLTPADAAAAQLFGGRFEGEILVAMASARTMTAARLLLAQGALWAAWMARWKAFLERAPGGGLRQFHSAVQWVLETSRSARRHLVPPRVAIIGPPNAGKSTLANALLGRPVAITSDIPGTTRDWVDADAVFRGNESPAGVAELRVTLIDTAGIRQTIDAIEVQSIERSHEQARAADAVIALFDATALPTREQLALAVPRQGCPVIVAVNKIDAIRDVPAALAGYRPLAISARTGAGLEALMQGVLEALGVAEPLPLPIAFSPRVREILTRVAGEEAPDACCRLLDLILA